MNTHSLKSTYTNTHGCKFTPSKPNEARHAISSDFTSCSFVF